MAKKQSTNQTSRDFVLARLAAARAFAARINEGIDTAIDIFVAPDDDEDGEGRREIIEELLDDIGGLTRSIDAAQGACVGDESFDWAEGEPDFEDDEGDDDEGEGAEDDTEDDAA